MYFSKLESYLPTNSKRLLREILKNVPYRKKEALDMLYKL